MLSALINSKYGIMINMIKTEERYGRKPITVPRRGQNRRAPTPLKGLPQTGTQYHPDVSKEPDAAERTAEIIPPTKPYPTVKASRIRRLLANPYAAAAQAAIRSAARNPAASTTNTAAANLSVRAVSL